MKNDAVIKKAVKDYFEGGKGKDQKEELESIKKQIANYKLDLVRLKKEAEELEKITKRLGKHILEKVETATNVAATELANIRENLETKGIALDKQIKKYNSLVQQAEGELIEAKAKKRVQDAREESLNRREEELSEKEKKVKQVKELLDG